MKLACDRISLKAYYLFIAFRAPILAAIKHWPTTDALGKWMVLSSSLLQRSDSCLWLLATIAFLPRLHLVLRWEFCLSVSPSVCQTRGLWQNGRKICEICIPYERTFILVFWRKRTVGGDDPFYLKFWVNWPQLERNRRFWTDNHSSRLGHNT